MAAPKDPQNRGSTVLGWIVGTLIQTYGKIRVNHSDFLSKNDIRIIRSFVLAISKGGSAMWWISIKISVCIEAWYRWKSNSEARIWGHKFNLFFLRHYLDVCRLILFKVRFRSGIGSQVVRSITGTWILSDHGASIHVEIMVDILPSSILLPSSFSYESVSPSIVRTPYTRQSSRLWFKVLLEI